jgi:Schlafen, AlbA_2
MNEPSLPELIYTPEGPKLDLKERPWDLDTQEGKAEFIKDVSAIANSPGSQNGYVLLGITDQDRRVIGIARDILQEERLQQIVAEYVEPPLTLSYTVRPLLQKYVGVITIPPSKSKPHLIQKNIDRLREGTSYTRRGSTTQLAKSSDLRAMIEEVLHDTRVEEDGISKWEWSRTDLMRLDSFALAILQSFIETDRTELSMTEIKDHCRHELADRAEAGKSVAGKMKKFYSKHGKEKLVEKNQLTGRWRFNDKYRSRVKELLHERGFI